MGDGQPLSAPIVTSVGVVIIQYGATGLDALVASLRDVPAIGPILVVRNPRSPDETAGVPDGATLVVLDRNAGYSTAANVGRRHPALAALPYVLVVTQDALLYPGCADALLGALTADASIAVAGPVLIDAANDEAFMGGTRSRLGHVRHVRVAWPRAEPTREPHPEPVDATWIDGAVMLLRTAVAPAFDERFFLYVEDVALCLAVRPSHRVVIVPTAVAAQTSGMASRSGAHGYLLTRNHLLLGRGRHERFAVLFGLLRSGTSLAAQIARAVKPGGRRRHLRQAFGIVWGVLDGLRGVTGAPPPFLQRWGDITSARTGRAPQG